MTKIWGADDKDSCLLRQGLDETEREGKEGGREERAGMEGKEAGREREQHKPKSYQPPRSVAEQPS